MLRIMRDHIEIGARGLVRLGAPLLPVAKGAERDLVALRELFMTEAERESQGLDARHTVKARALSGSQRRVVGILASGGLDACV